MVSETLLNKAAALEKCVARAKEEYEKDTESFENDNTRQDAAILNIERACETALDMGHVYIRENKLGIPQSSRNVFELLAEGNVISKEFSETLKKMVGFRNIAIHDYQSIKFPIILEIIKTHLDDLLKFSKILVKDTEA
jgi:uncharacterized protein YutE (UPF0331/DUF86 family)